VTSAQRHVAVIALGLVCIVVASALIRHLDDDQGGWFMYQPNATTLFSGSSEAPVLRSAGIWLGAIAVWAAVSAWLYRRRDG
jgi:hypothetical protein